MARDNFSSGIAWLVMLAIIGGLILLGELLLSDEGEARATETGAAIIMLIVGAVGAFGFFYKPR
jgi:hypothetical protein